MVQRAKSCDCKFKVNQNTYIREEGLEKSLAEYRCWKCFSGSMKIFKKPVLLLTLLYWSDTLGRTRLLYISGYKNTGFTSPNYRLLAWKCYSMTVIHFRRHSVGAKEKATIEKTTIEKTEKLILEWTQWLNCVVRGQENYFPSIFTLYQGPTE